MRLKKIEIFGFKSFAEKTQIHFDAPLIAIVGPNGCGKSNLVDAFLWVLGEQSARALRGEKMHDVLFSGSEGEKPFNMAEVSLTLSDVKEGIPSPYDEITITRRIYRDGETKYLINRKEVRLKDIHELFLDSGLGKHGLFVVEQGKIDEIIHLTPEKRRLIFEEAAGVGRFLHKRKEADEKLKEVRVNELRLNDVKSEVERSLQQLQKQALIAKNVQSLREEKEVLERALFHKKRADLMEEIERAEKEKSGFEGRIEELKRDIHSLEVEIERLVALEKREFAVFKPLEESCFKIEGGVSLLKEEKAQLERKKRTSSVDRAQLEERARTQKALMEEKEASLKESVEKEKEKGRELIRSAEELSSLQNQLQKKELQKRGAEEKSFQAEEMLKRRRKEIQKIQEKEALKREYVQDLLTLLEEEKKSLSLLSVKRDELKKRNRGMEAEVAAIRQKEKVLLEFRGEKKEGREAILEESNKPKSPLFGLVQEMADYITLEEEPLSRRYEETLIVKDESAQWRVVEFAEKRGLSNFSLLAQERVKNLFLKVKSYTTEKGSYFIDEQGALFSFGTKSLLYQKIVLKEEGKKKRELEEALKVGLSQEKEVELELLKQEGARRKKEMTLVEENFFLQRAKEDLLREEKECAKLETGQREAASLLEKLEEDLRPLAFKREELIEKKEQIKRELSEIEKKCEKEREEFEKVKRVQQEIRELEMRWADEKRERERALYIEAEIAALEEKLKALSQKKESAHKSYLQSVAEKKSVERAREEHRKRLSLVEKEWQAAGFKLNETKRRKEEIDQDSHLSDQATPLTMPIKEAEKRRGELEKMLSQYQSVNMESISQSEEEERRFALLDRELKDVVEARACAEKLIQQLERESRGRLKETFNQVRSSFQKNFTLLFEGGEADLVLTKEDILEAGVEILAKPPGKKMRALSLLSGGERSLVTIALLFSLFEMKPAPFCLLDEIDSPLDDANVERFTRLVREFSTSVQFLCVTHNKKTMSMADVLVGVSMERKGVSKLLALPLNTRS